MVQGELSAYSQEDAIRKLKAKELVPVSFEEQRILFDIPTLLKEIKLIRTRDLSIFFRQLAAVFAAGLPFIEALNSVQEQVSNHNLKVIAEKIKTDVEGGLSFSQAMAKYPGTFPSLIVSMVEAGERGGVLGDVLHRISSYLEKESQTQNKIQAALRYPVIVLSVLGFAFIFAVTFIIPRFEHIFSGFHTALPLPTRILLGINFAVVNYWWLLILGLIALGYAFRSYISRPEGMYQWDLVKLKMPILGVIITKLSLSRFFRMLSAMIQSGIPLTTALEVTAKTTDNAVISTMIQRVRAQVIAGSALSLAMKEHSLFPSMAVQMVAIGEKSGTLDKMLVKSADYFDEESDYIITNLMTYLEPLLIFVLAMLVLLLALGIFLPMWNMLQLYSQ